jgi:hypothetical protein
VIQNAEANSKEGRYMIGITITGILHATDSDWGSYAGSQTNYYDNSWGWGSPWGWGDGMAESILGYEWRMGLELGLSWGWGGSGAGTAGTLGDTRTGGYYNPYWGGYYGIHIGAGMADTGVIITQYHTKEEEQTEDYITATTEDLVIKMV